MTASPTDIDGEREVIAAAPEEAGKRLDQWLAARMGGRLSRSRIKALIEDGQVILDGAVTREPKRRIGSASQATIAVPPPADPVPRGEPIALDVLHEDADIIVIDKPAGMVVHPAAGNRAGTLVNALIHHCGDSLSGIGGVRRPGIVHRLDKDTSGVMVAAKNDAAHAHLSAQFADHGKTGAMRRIYAALVWGAPGRAAGTIATHLGRSSSDRTKQAVVSDTRPDARHAVTRFKVLHRYGAADAPVASLVECELETGRTHQIRVHMAHIGHPLIGDGVYGAGFASKARILPEPARQVIDDLGRQALHARTLTVEHPATGAAMTFQTPLPADIARVADLLRAHRAP